MRKSWLPTIAVSLGWIGSTAAFGQYPNAHNNFGPSAFPIAPQPPTQSVLQSLPQVPQYAPQQVSANLYTPNQYFPNQQYAHPAQAATAAPFQLVAAEDQSGATYSLPAGGQAQGIASVPGATEVVQPQTMQPAAIGNAGCNTCQRTRVESYQPAIEHGYHQAVAPACNSCGPAPVSGTIAPGSATHQHAGGHGLAGHSKFFGKAFGGLGAGLGQGLPAGAKPWFFGAGALIFNRIDNHNVPLGFRDDSYATDILTTESARMGTTGGVEASIGRYLNCGRNAIQATYWGLFPDEQIALNAGTVAGEYASRIPFSYMQMSGTPDVPGVAYNVYDWYDNAFAYELRRSSNYHNVEVNLLGFAMGGAARNFNMATTGTLFSGLGGHRGGGHCGYCGGAGCGACGSCGTGACGPAPSRFATGPCCLTAPSCGSRLNVTWLGGLRYFHFADNLQYAASLADSVIDRSADDIYYNVDTTNNLFGFQLGSRADYCVGSRLNLYGTTKVGLFNNRSRLLTRLGTDTENATLSDTRTPVNPDDDGEYDFDETQDNLAFLSELGTGIGVRMSPKWTGTVGYRAVVLSGVATSPDNVRSTFAYFNDIVNYDTSNTLILHGLNVGALYNY